MKLTKILAVVAVVGGLGVGTSPFAQAQTSNQQPAEFPSSSYKGKQYVDSKGCVFIRAGIDGNVSWVPRMSRDRKTVCGFKPTAGARPAVAAAPAAKAPVQITLDTPPAAAAPAPAAPRRAAAPAPRRAAASVVVRQTAPRPAPKPRVVAAAPRVIKPAPVIVPQVRRTTTTTAGASACRGASAISQRYLRGEGVRCGPQTQPVVGNRAPVAAAPRSYGQAAAPTAIRPHYGAVASAPRVTSTTRIAPKHVVKKRINTRNVNVPKGYREVWNDDRLNPKRAEQNLAGRSGMLLIWTQSVPRRLINQATGRDVTATVPLVYPYTSIAQQERELGKVEIMQRNGQTVKRIKRHSHAAPVARKPVYSTRSAPKAAAPQPARRAAAPSGALAGKRYVQIGTFTNPANAQRAAQSIARMGMPARIGKIRKGSKRYMTVQAGPFNGANALGNAMNRLRGAGYRDAFAK